MKGFMLGVGLTAGVVAGACTWFWYWLYRNQP